MRKTINLTEDEVEKVEAYGKREGLKTFSDSVRHIINNMYNKSDIRSLHIAPKGAGEVK